MRLVNIGYGNMVAAGRVVAVVSPESAPVKRMVQDGKAAGRVIDATLGRKTRSVLIMDSGHIVLAAIQTTAVNDRLTGRETAPTEEETL